MSGSPGSITRHEEELMPNRTLSAAERYAALVALRAGLDDQIAAAKHAVTREAADQRSASWSTPWGPVNAARRDPGIVVDGDALLAYVEEHHPEDIVTTRSVSPQAAHALAADLVVVGGNVMRKSTGEVVEWATVGAPGPLVVSYPASTQQRDAKDLARMLFEERSEALLGGLLEVTA